MTIGELQAQAAPLLRQHGLTPFRHILPPDLFAALAPWRQPSWTVLIPEVVFWLMRVPAAPEAELPVTTKIDLTPSPIAKPWGRAIIAATVVLYILFF